MPFVREFRENHFRSEKTGSKAVKSKNPAEKQPDLYACIPLNRVFRHWCSAAVLPVNQEHSIPGCL